MSDGLGHAFQDDDLWRLLKRAPKRMVVGPWGHTYPPLSGPSRPSWAAPVERPGSGTSAGFDRVLLEWFDHWLRQPFEQALAAGGAVREGVVEHQASDGTWHEATAWPPTGRRQVLHLAGSTLSAEAAPAATTRSFVSAPQAVTLVDGIPRDGDEYWPYAAATCPVGDEPRSSGVQWLSEPVAEPVHLAGNPRAYLRLESGQGGGLVMLQLLDVAPGFDCSDDDPYDDVKTITGGGVDLRFRDGGFTADEVTPGKITEIPVDLYNDSYVLKPGHRLALTASYGDLYDRSTSPRYTPTITVHRGSAVELPVLSGTLGGRRDRGR